MQRRAPTPKRVFRDRINRFKQDFSQADPKTFDALELIADDPRGVAVREFVVTQPEKVGALFLQHLIWAFWLSGLSCHERREETWYDIHETRNDIERAISACEFLVDFCCSRSNRFKFPLAAHIEHDTWQKLLRIKNDLQIEKQFAMDQLSWDGELQHGKPRHVFIRAMNAAKCKLFVQPSDNVIADAASILFDRDVSSEAVKKARSRARHR